MKTLLATASKCTLDKFYEQPLGKSLFKGEKLSWDGESYNAKGKMYFTEFRRQLKYEVTPVIFPLNKWGLPFIYNAVLELPNISEYECVIFVHDDVALQHIDMLSIIKQQFDEGYSIVGLAGAQNVSIQKPALWHIMSASNKDGWSGSVAHPHRGGVIMTPFGESPKRVLLLDGLFLAVKVKDILEKNIRFDEQFTFHLYDLDFCLQCNKVGLKLTTAPIWVTHQSPGLSSLGDEVFLQNQSKFLAKWGQG